LLRNLVDARYAAIKSLHLDFKNRGLLLVVNQSKRLEQVYCVPYCTGD